MDRTSPHPFTLGSVVAFLALALLPPATFGGEEILRLSPAEAVRLAVERNPALRASSFAPRIASASVQAARGAFDPVLSASVGGGASRTPEPAPPPDSSDLSTFDARAGATALLPTGATAGLTAGSLWSHRESGGAALSSGEASLAASMRQPLLKGAGRRVAEGGVRSALLDQRSAEAAYRDETLSTAFQALSLYLASARSLKTVETRLSSLEAARRLHAENQGRVKAGLLAPVELLESELAIAQREAALVDAERARDTASDAFRAFLGLPSSTRAVVEDVTSSPLPQVPEEPEGTALFPRERPDVERARNDLEAQEHRLFLSRDALLPSLDTVGEATLAGVDGGAGGAWEDAASARYPAWSLSLQFSLPLGNRAARAAADSASFSVGQSRANLDAALLRAETEVRAAYRLVDARTRSEAAQAKAVEVGRTRVESFRRKLSLGLATTRNLLDAETDLVQAEELLTAARIDHRLARYEVLRATGLLGERFSLDPGSRPPTPAEAK